MLSEKEFYDYEISLGITGDNPDFVKLTELTANQLNFEYKTVLDYGAGLGVYANTFKRKGYQVYVWDKFRIHVKHIKEHYPDLTILKQPLTTDLMLFIEVAEHMTDDQLFNLFQKIKPTYILFSSTSQKTEKDKEWGHINIKEQDEWLKVFNWLGYKFVRDLQYPTKWSKLFKCAS